VKPSTYRKVNRFVLQKQHGRYDAKIIATSFSHLEVLAEADPLWVDPDGEEEEVGPADEVREGLVGDDPALHRLAQPHALGLLVLAHLQLARVQERLEVGHRGELGVALVQGVTEVLDLGLDICRIYIGIREYT
jgi:hypothetical protein